MFNWGGDLSIRVECIVGLAEYGVRYSEVKDDKAALTRARTIGAINLNLSGSTKVTPYMARGELTSTKIDIYTFHRRL